MLKLLRFMKGLEGKAILAPLFKLFEAVLELFVPLCVASLIDKGLGGGSLNYVLRMFLYMFLLALFGLIASITAQYFSADVSAEMARRLKSALFKHIESLSSLERDKLGPSTLITRMLSDANQVQVAVNMFLRLFLRSPFVVLGAFVMALSVERSLSWLFALVIVLLSIVVFLIMNFTLPLYKKVQLRLDKVMSKTRENLSGVRVIRAFNKQEEEIESYDRALESLKKEMTKTGRVSSLLNPITMVIVNLAVVYLVYLGNKKYQLNLIEIGVIVALVNYMNQILTELVKFANLIVTLTRGLASASRIQNIFEIKTTIFDKEDAKCGNEDSEDAIEFDKASLFYSLSESPALDEISFKIKRGEKVGIIGATGSGKTSVVSLIPRLYDVTRGSVKVFSLDVKDWKLENLRSLISYAPQKARLFKGSIRDNVKLGNPSATDEEIIEALKEAEALEFVEKKEGFLDYLIEQNGKNLSGGQKQRLVIARTLVRKAKIIILDDSASALDYQTESKLRKTLFSLSGITLIVISQRTSSLMNMDKIILLEKGKVAGIGSHETLLENNEIYREIYYSQYEEKKDAQ